MKKIAREEDHWEISANHRDELIEKLKSIDISVPPRGSERKNWHVERWSICRLLSSLAYKNNFRHPLQIEQRESPDFLLFENGIKIGIELTEAIQEDYAHALALFAKKVEQSGSNFKLAPESDLFKWNDRKKSNKELRELASPREKLIGPGWEGDEIERELVQAIFDTTNKKTKLLNKPHFETFDENWLLIYNSLEAGLLDPDYTTKTLINKLNSYWNDHPIFNRIIVEFEGRNSFLSISKNGCECYKIYDIWRGKK